MHLFRSLMLVALVCLTARWAEADQRLGVGAHYWRTVDNLHSDIDRDGISWLVTYQNEILPLLKLQLDAEIFPSGFAGSDKAVYAPQILGIVGSWLYVGLGVGILYADSELAERPFYLARAGLDIPLPLPVRLDINANYHFSEWKGLNAIADEVQSDTVTLGAAIRFEF